MRGRFALGVVYGVCAVGFLGHKIRYVLHAARKVENNLAGKADVLTGKAFQPQQLVYLGFVLAVKAFAVVFGWLISILPFPRFGIGVIEPLLVVLVEVNKNRFALLVVAGICPHIGHLLAGALAVIPEPFIRNIKGHLLPHTATPAASHASLYLRIRSASSFPMSCVNPDADSSAPSSALMYSGTAGRKSPVAGIAQGSDANLDETFLLFHNYTAFALIGSQRENRYRALYSGNRTSMTFSASG